MIKKLTNFCGRKYKRKLKLALKTKLDITSYNVDITHLLINNNNCCNN